MHQLVGFHEQSASTRTDVECKPLQRPNDAPDHQIDHLVYELYNLSGEEIAIVEGEVG